MGLRQEIQEKLRIRKHSLPSEPLERVLETIRVRPDGKESIQTKELVHFLNEIHEDYANLSSTSSVYAELLGLNQQILLAENLSSILQKILDTAKKAAQGSAASLLLLDHRTGELLFHVATGSNTEELKEIRIPPGHGIAYRVIKTHKAEIIHDFSKDNYAYDEVDKQIGNITRNMIAVPLVVDGVSIGALEVINSIAEEGFNEENLELIQNIAFHIALLIENVKAKENLLKTVRELDRQVSHTKTMLKISTLLSKAETVTSLRKILITSILESNPIDIGMIYLFDHDTRKLKGEIGFQSDGSSNNHRGSNGILKTMELPELSNYLDVILWLKENREPMIFKEGEEEEGIAYRFMSDNTHAFSQVGNPTIILPIFKDGAEQLEFILIFGKGALRPNASTSDIDFYKSIALIAGSAIQNAEIREKSLESAAQG